jgi:hypothetical protein
MEIVRPIKLIQIADNEYRLSGCFVYNSQRREWIEIDGKEYHRDYVEPKKYDLDEDWILNNKPKFYDETKCPITEDNFLGVIGWRDAKEGDIIDHDCHNTYNWNRYKLDFMEIFDLPSIIIWEPNGWTRSFFRDIYPLVGSGNDYVVMLQTLNYLGLFKKIDGHFWTGKKRDFFDKDTYSIIIDHYGFNNSVGFDFDFKGLIQYDLLKLVDYLDHYHVSEDFPGRHNKVIDKIIKDYYQKTGSINDSDRVNILSNYIMGLTVEN